MEINELRETLRFLPQEDLDLLDYVIISGDKNLTTTDYRTLKDMARKGLVAYDKYFENYYYFATRLGDYWKTRAENDN